MTLDLYKNPLFTDFYQLTMLQIYYKYGLDNKKVKFDYFFRNYPDYGEHKAGYCIFAGLQPFCSWLECLNFPNDILNKMKSSKTATGDQLFTSDYLQWLSDEKFIDSLTIHSVDEGRVVHTNEPLMVIEANLATAQIIESSVLNHCNFQTLIATKASRIRHAGENRPIIEFGLRRAHGKGALNATRAALIGGADFSSNTVESYHLNIPPKGTHAHSMVQMFIALGEGELGAFRAYADIYPDDCLLLVDTINTLESGIPNAIKVFEELKKRGHKPIGIRLDSGDLAHLAIKASLMLDKAGFQDTVIILSNDIDELILMQVLRQIREEAKNYGMDPDKIINRLVYGVGTKLVTSQGRSSLDGVYKLTAVKKNGNWIPSLKISETVEKTIIPGSKIIYRIYDNDGKATADLVCLDDEDPNTQEEIILKHPLEPDLFRKLTKSTISRIEPLLKTIIKDGKQLQPFPSIYEIRKKCASDLESLDVGVRRIINPHIYHISISEKLFNMKSELLHNRGMQ